MWFLWFALGFLTGAVLGALGATFYVLFHTTERF